MNYFLRGNRPPSPFVLASVGIVDLGAIDAVCVDGRYGALCWVAPRDVRKAAQILGAL